MPPLEVYSINFANGSLQPSLDANGWQAMRFGGSSAGTLQTTFGNGGLYLSAERPLGAKDRGVHNSVYVLPPVPTETGASVPGMLSLASRLIMRVEFDLPDAVAAGPGVKAEAWAVVLRLKFANNPLEPRERDVPDEPSINVTCQFNNNTNGRNGVRLNDPDRAQDATTNKAPDLDSPLSYSRYKPGCFGLGRATQFILSFAFSGIQAGPVPTGTRKLGDPLGYAVGCGFLEMLGVPRFRKDNLKDHRLFSSTNLSSGTQDWIGALGVSITSLSGQGKFSVRLRRFSISTLT